MSKEPMESESDRSSKEKELQKKYLQYQVLQQQLHALGEEKSRVDAALSEIRAAIIAIEKLGNSKGDSLSPIGSRTYVSTELKDSENVIIGVGSGVFLKKKRQEAAEIMGKRKEELEKFNAEIERQVQHASMSLQIIEHELQGVIGRHEY